ncbi:hypothetical protein BY996DRAFT_6594002 [Phakopsora pachyrhizi]|nr:hypothetical protein BY996DRAFT_6594002 [Phakopsora pachyrhizi]
MPEEGSTRVATVAVKLPKAERAGLGRVGTAGRVIWISQGRRHIAGPTTYRRADDISQGRRRKGYLGTDDVGKRCAATRCRYRRTDNTNRRTDEGKNTLLEKQRLGRRAAGEDIKEMGGAGRGMKGMKKGREGELEVSVGLVRRRETPRRLEDRRETVRRAVGRDGRAGRRARRRHTDVRSSYHFRT